jgi:hypothetical protein
VLILELLPVESIISFGVVPNLQTLTFTFVVLPYMKSRFLNGFHSMILFLKDPSLLKSLRELILCIEVHSYDWDLGSLRPEWTTLDLILSNIPTLHRLLIRIGLPQSQITSDALEKHRQSVVKDCLTLSAERGTLSIVVGSMDDLDKDTWSLSQ